MLVLWESERLCIVFQFVPQAGLPQVAWFRLSRSSWQVLVCSDATLAVGGLPNICWLDRPGYQTRSIKDTPLSYGSLPFSRINQSTVLTYTGGQCGRYNLIKLYWHHYTVASFDTPPPLLAVHDWIAPVDLERTFCPRLASVSCS